MKPRPLRKGRPFYWAQMKTNVEIQDELLIAAKKHAAKRQITLRALIEAVCVTN